jgi:hypothetical protein
MGRRSLARGRLGGAEPLAQALLILFTAGLVWQFVLVLLLTRHELGTHPLKERNGDA